MLPCAPSLPTTALWHLRRCLRCGTELPVPPGPAWPGKAAAALSFCGFLLKARLPRGTKRETRHANEHFIPTPSPGRNHPFKLERPVTAAPGQGSRAIILALWRTAALTAPHPPRQYRHSGGICTGRLSSGQRYLQGVVQVASGLVKGLFGSLCGVAHSSQSVDIFQAASPLLLLFLPNLGQFL